MLSFSFLHNGGGVLQAEEITGYTPEGHHSRLDWTGWPSVLGVRTCIGLALFSLSHSLASFCFSLLFHASCTFVFRFRFPTGGCRVPSNQKRADKLAGQSKNSNSSPLSSILPPLLAGRGRTDGRETLHGLGGGLGAFFCASKNKEEKGVGTSCRARGSGNGS